MRRLLLSLLCLAAALSAPALSTPTAGAAGDAAEIVLQVGHAGTFAYVEGLAFSPDGTRLATSDDSEVKLWDTRSAELVRTFTPVEFLPGGGSNLAFSPDGSRLATAVGDRVLVWDPADGRRLQTLDAPAEIMSLAWSPDGRRLAGGVWRGGAVLWDAATGREVRRLGNTEKQWFTVAFSPDGRVLATSGGEVHIWSAGTGELLGTLAGHGATAVRGLGFCRDGRLASAGRDGTLRLWDPASRKELRRWEAQGVDKKDGYGALAIAPDGRHIAVALNRQVAIYDAGSEAPPQVIAGELDSGQLAFSRDGRWLAFGQGDHVRLATVPEGQLSMQLAGRRARPRQPRASPDGRLLATLDTDGALRLWDAETLALSRILQVDADNWVEEAAFSPDSARVATLSHRTDVKVWDTRSGAVALTLAGHGSHARAVAYSRDGSRIATGDFEGDVRIWDARTGQLEQTIATGSMVDLVRFLDEGSSIAAAQRNKPARVFALATGALSRTIEDPLELDPEEAPTRRRLAQLVPPQRTVGAIHFEGHLALSPDKKQVAVVDFGRPTRMHDVESGRVAWTQPVSEPILMPRWFPDGRLLFSADADGLLRVREAASGRLIVSVAALPGAAGQGSAAWITYTPDGYFDGSPGAEVFIRWRVAGKLLPASARPDRRRPDIVRQRLAGGGPDQARR